MSELCPMPGCRVERVARESPNLLHVAARGTRPGGRCPDCGRASRAVHSRYRRRPSDLPTLGSRVRVGLFVRRFYCRNPGCARRALRLAEAQGRVGAALGGEGGARLLSRLAMPASADTVLRLVRRLPLPEPEPARVVAVDDWTLRKGRTYGTIVVDLEHRRVLDLLPDRAAETLADWLRARPGVEIVARDRSTEYARAIALGAPTAVQVADRWHLLANMRQVLERWLAGAQARLRRLLPPGSAASADTRQRSGRRTGPFPRSAAEMRARAGRRERRIALYEEVRRRRAAAETLLAIGRAVGLAVNTVRKYAAAESFPVPERQRPWPSILDPTSPTCRRGSPKAARARGCSGARCAPWASRERTSRCNAGSRSTGPHPPPRRPDRASYPCCLPQHSSRGCSSNPRRRCRPTMPPRRRGSSRTARPRASRPWSAASPPSCAAAGRAATPTPRRRSPNWTPGSPTPAPAACAPSRPSRGAGAGRRGGARRAHHALEQRPGRGTNHSAQADQAAKLRPRRLRPAAPARSDRGMIHAKRGRATILNALSFMVHALKRPRNA